MGGMREQMQLQIKKRCKQMPWQMHRQMRNRRSDRIFDGVFLPWSMGPGVLYDICLMVMFVFFLLCFDCKLDRLLVCLVVCLCLVNLLKYVLRCHREEFTLSCGVTTKLKCYRQDLKKTW